MADHSHSHAPGLENPGTLDAIAYNEETNEVLLAMYEMRPWSDLDLQLFQLQEKLNAYLSFALDGEMRENYPDFADKKIRLQLRARHEPPAKILEFAALVRKQLEFQDIAFEVILIEECSEDQCGCSHDH